MTKEYTGPEFEVEFARAWLKYVEGGKVGVDPRNAWESFQLNCYGWEGRHVAPQCFADHKYRWKPAPKRMVNIGYMSGGTWLRKELVAPEVEAPVIGTVYFYRDVEYVWRRDFHDLKWLESGEVFLTREDAQAMSDWLAICRKGGQS